MQENDENEEEKLVDVKGVLENFIKEEPPQLSQEEAIMQYKENVDVNKKRKGNADEENEDDEHLKRIKKALLESLERVNALAKKLFEEKEKESLKDIKVEPKKGSGSGGKGKGMGEKDKMEKLEEIEPIRQENDERSRD